MTEELEKVIKEELYSWSSPEQFGEFKRGAEKGFKIAMESEQVQGLLKKTQKYEEIIKNIYETCLCERFETYGFDYHEQHPNRDKNNGGSRPNTPKDYIEKEIGFDWEYENPEGCCKSWKVLKLNVLEKFRGKE